MFSNLFLHRLGHKLFDPLVALLERLVVIVAGELYSRENKRNGFAK